MKYLLALLLPLLLLAATPVFALDEPPAYTINNVWAFRHIVETGDFLVLGRITLNKDLVNGDCSPSYSAALTANSLAGDTTLEVGSATLLQAILTANGYVSLFISDSDSSETVYVASIALSPAVITIAPGVVQNYTTAAGADVIAHPDTQKGDGDWDCYTSSDAFVRLANTVGVVVELRTAVRTGPGLVGFYLDAVDFAAAAPNLTWGDASTVQLFASPTVFDSPPVASSPISWCATCTSPVLSLTALHERLKSYMRSIQSENPIQYPGGSLIEADAITVAGASLIAEAFPVLVRPLAITFQVETEMAGQAFDPPGRQLLTFNAAAGQPSIRVADITVFQAGMLVFLQDTTPDTEIKEVLTTVAPDRVTMTADLVNNYTVAADASVSYLAVDIIAEQTKTDTTRLAVEGLGTSFGLGAGVSSLLVVGALTAGLWIALFMAGAGGLLSTTSVISVTIFAGLAGWITLGVAILAVFVVAVLVAVIIIKKFVSAG